MQKLKQNRIASFITVAIVYVIATLAGIVTYRALSLPWWISLLIADVLATAVTFVFSVIFGNASVYDPYWSVQPPVILAAFAIGKGLSVFSVLLILVMSIWAIRLTLNWAYTFKDLTHQDWRYTMLKEKTGAFYPIINFIGIHMVPTLVVYGCTLPGVYAILHNTVTGVGSFIFLLVSLFAITIQTFADIEMHRFRKDRSTTFIRVGLWKYSRHPNYLGEILMWWGVAISVVLAHPSAWYLLSGAFANTVLFFAVSIPVADKRQSRKPGFAEYKAETRMLLPFKKRLK